MPVIGYVMGPVFGGESAERDAALYENSLAIEAAQKPLRTMAADGGFNPEHGGELVRAFLANAEAREAVAKVHSTLKEAMILNQYKDEGQYTTLVGRAREWNRMFKGACLTEIPVPSVAKAEPADAAPVVETAAPLTFTQRVRALLPSLGR